MKRIPVARLYRQIPTHVLFVEGAKRVDRYLCYSDDEVRQVMVNFIQTARRIHMLTLHVGKRVQINSRPVSLELKKGSPR